MRRKKSRFEILTRSPVINQTDIERLLNVSQYTAAKIFRYAQRAEQNANESGWWSEERKVRLTSALKVYGVTYEALKKQIIDEERIA
jgi:hypothetical protein